MEEYLKLELDRNDCQVKNYDVFYEKFLLIINDSYKKFKEHLFGENFAIFLSKKYKNRYIESIHIIFVKCLPFIKNPYTEDFFDSLGSISKDEGDLIQLPTDKSEWEKADILWDVLKDLIDMWKINQNI